MANKTPYEQLNVTEKVRVNAVILDLFSKNDNFVRGFQREATDNKQGFQATLDNVRNILATHMGQVPDVTKNGVDDNSDLQVQRTILREEGQLFDSELKTGQKYTVDQYKTIFRKAVADAKHVGDPDYKLPQPVGDCSGVTALMPKIVPPTKQTSLDSSVTMADVVVPGVPNAKGATTQRA